MSEALCLKLMLQRISQIQKAKDLNFPDLIRHMREGFGKRRHDVEREIGISEWKLVRLEDGNISEKYFPLHEIKVLAKYFGLDEDALLEKCKKYLEQQKYRSLPFMKFKETSKTL